MLVAIAQTNSAIGGRVRAVSRALCGYDEMATQSQTAAFPRADLSTQGYQTFDESNAT